MKNLEFSPAERAAGRPPSQAEIDRIENISKKWDESQKLQEKYPNFYDYLASIAAKKGGRAMNDNIADCVFDALDTIEGVKDDTQEATDAVVDDSPVLRGILDHADEVYARNYWEDRPGMQRKFLTVEGWIKHLEKQMNPGSRR